MEKQKDQITLIKEAAEKSGYVVKQISSVGETMLGDAIKVSDSSNFWIVSTRRIGFFPNTSAWFKMLCNSKETSFKILQGLGFNAIESVYVGSKDFEKTYSSTNIHKLITDFPVVCKPENGLRGESIKMASDAEELENYFIESKETNTNFLIQPIITGNEYRIAVFEGVVFAMHNRNFYLMEGNGQDTIQQLCEKRRTFPEMNFVNYILKKKTTPPTQYYLREKLYLPESLKTTATRYLKRLIFQNQLETGL